MIDNKEKYIEIVDSLITRVNAYNYRFDKDKGIGIEFTRVSKQVENYKTILEVEKERLENLNKGKTKKWTLDDTIGAVERFTKFPMPENCTVRKFLSHLNAMLNPPKSEANA